MWTKLVEIVKAQWRQNDRPRRRLAKGALMLYGAMSNCREAFLRYKTAPSERAFANFAFAIEALLSTLENLDFAFHIFDEELTAMLQAHTIERPRETAFDDPAELVRAQIKLLRLVVKVEFDNMDLTPATIGEFDDALDMLGTFIKQRFTKDDLFGAFDRSTGNSAVRHNALAGPA